MNVLQRFGTLLVILTLLLAPVRQSHAQTSDNEQYFPETGHTVKGEFLHFYRNAADPALIYGFPISEQFTSRDGKIVQYFERARFELNGDLPGNGSVLRTPLGRAAYEAGSPKLDINNPAACRSFQTGYQVCFAFLDFYQANGGTAQFGNPISPFEFHENLIVQYFENARFEWRADRPEGQRVVLTDLGRLYFDRLAEDPAQLRPIRTLNATISSILSIHARAFVKHAITQSTGQQTVYIVVQSQTNQPVADANGKATIHFTDQHTEEYFFTANSSGLGSVTFNFENQRAGELVPIEIIVAYQGLAAKTTASFRIWY
jgi:hypothetical protein